MLCCLLYGSISAWCGGIIMKKEIENRPLPVSCYFEKKRQRTVPFLSPVILKKKRQRTVPCLFLSLLGTFSVSLCLFSVV